MKPYFKKLLILMFFVGGFSLTWTVIYLHKMEEATELRLKGQTLSNEELAKIYDEILGTVENEDLALVEMSLAMIRNYYVDAKQFDFEKLILASLENMKNHGTLNYKVKPEIIELYDEASSKTLSKFWMQDEIGKVAIIFSIAQFLNDHHKLRDEKNAIFETLSIIISSLDPYSRLLSEEDYRELKEGTEGEFGGLGVMVGVRDNLLTIMKILPNSPAQRAGLLPMDHILSVNGENTFGASMEELLKVMRGLPGSKATVSILREGAKKPFEVSMSRELVQIDPVSMKHIKTPEKNDVLLLKLDTFSLKSYDRLRYEIEKAISSKKNPTDGIILDLRSNPGGLLDQAVKISKLLVPEGSIVTVKGRELETEYANHENLNINCPVIVLIDEDSASASEILAGALKDHDRAIVIGQPSYGKGTVQTVFELPKGQALKLTIARYLTPSGNSIQGVGVIPDVWLHPIFKYGANTNLMGQYRYRLDPPFIGFNPSKAALFSSSRTMVGYYIKDNESSEDSTKEVQLALNVFDEYKKDATHTNSLKHSSILSKLKLKIKNKMDVWDLEASRYLQNMKVNWFAQKEMSPLDIMKIVDIKVKAPEKIYPGSSFDVSVQVQNTSNNPIPRSSMFVRAMYHDMTSIEKLIGNIKPQETIQDLIHIDIPTHWIAGKVVFQVGLADDGMEIKESIKDFSINIQKRKDPILTVSANLPELLKPGSSEDLIVFVKNESDTDVHVDKIQITNLSGRQLILKDDQSSNLHEISAHEEAKFAVRISGTKELDTDKLSLGLSIESHDLRQALNKIIYINTAQARSH